MIRYSDMQWMSLPPPVEPQVRDVRPSSSFTNVHAQSATLFVGRIVFAAILFTFGMAAIVLSPVVMQASPIAIVTTLAALIVAIVLVAARRRTRPPRDAGRWRRPPTRGDPRFRSRRVATHGRPRRPGSADWRLLAAVTASVVLLLVAPFVPDGIGGVLALTGLVGLMTLRVARAPGHRSRHGPHARR